MAQYPLRLPMCPQKSWKCPICGMEYPSEEQRDRHMVNSCGCVIPDSPRTTTMHPWKELPPPKLPKPALPPSTLPPSTLPPTTLPPSTLPPTTLPPSTLPPSTLPPSTLPSTTLSPTTLAPPALPPSTLPSPTLPPSTLPPSTLQLANPNVARIPPVRTSRRERFRSVPQDEQGASPIKLNKPPLEAETGTELCRVIKLEGGSLGGYRSDILTENLSEREGAIYKCARCSGIMIEGCICGAGQLCSCCLKGGEQSLCQAPVRNTILSLKCSCPLFKRGCEWLGRLESVENHLTTCGHLYESCQLLCGVVTTRDEMGRHVREECSQREEACLHCSGVHKVCEMVEHVKVCGKVEELCELRCGTRVRRESISCHRKSECSEESVVCPYEKYRCEVVGLKRRELTEHLEENRCLHTELKLNALEQNFETIVLSNNSLKDHITVLESKIQVLESQMENKDKQIAELNVEVEIRHEGVVNWRIPSTIAYFRPFFTKHSEKFAIAGYQFKLTLSTDAEDCHIQFNLLRGDNHSILDWPMIARFFTQFVCQGNAKRSLNLESRIISVERGDNYGLFNESPKRICSIPLNDLNDFIIGDSLDLKVTLRILKK